MGKEDGSVVLAQSHKTFLAVIFANNDYKSLKYWLALSTYDIGFWNGTVWDQKEIKISTIKNYLFLTAEYHLGFVQIMLLNLVIMHEFYWIN